MVFRKVCCGKVPKEKGEAVGRVDGGESGCCVVLIGEVVVNVEWCRPTNRKRGREWLGECRKQRARGMCGFLCEIVGGLLLRVH